MKKPTDVQMKEASKVGQVMAHPLRIEVLYLIGMWGRGSASKIATYLRMPISNISYHVLRLVDAGCLRLDDQRQGRSSMERIYGLSPAGQGVLELVTRLGGDAQIDDSPAPGDTP
jgi:DNA-binding transcriptional ArsR family regulator